jgi:PadR family transcriptional regulator, regulatory protein PadR
MARARDTHPHTVAVLRLLADSPADWRHGYDIARHTGLRSGTLYPLLVRLAERGYLDTRWESDPPPGRPRRHLYRLTASGIAHAAAQAPAGAATRPAATRPAVTRPVPEGA